MYGTDSEVVACGQKGTLLVKEQGTWQERATGTQENLWAVWASGDEIFAGGDKGTLVHCDATKCTSTTLEGPDALFAIWGRSPRDVFATGGKGTVLHFDGAAWKPWKLPTDEGVGAIGGDGHGGVIVTTRTADYRLTGDAWSSIGGGPAWSLAETGDGQVVAATGGGGLPIAIRRFDGATWHDEPVELGRYGNNWARFCGIWATGGEVFAVGDGGAVVHKRK